jgi:transposase-like protein
MQCPACTDGRVQIRIYFSSNIGRGVDWECKSCHADGSLPSTTVVGTPRWAEDATLYARAEIERRFFAERVRKHLAAALPVPEGPQGIPVGVGPFPIDPRPIFPTVMTELRCPSCKAPGKPTRKTLVSDKHSIWTVECSRCSRVSTSSDRALAEAPFTGVQAEHTSGVLRPPALMSQRAIDQVIREERARISQSERTWPKCKACGVDLVVRSKGTLSSSSVSIVLECMSL